MHYTSQVGLLSGFRGLSLAKPSREPLPSVAPLRWAVPRPGHQTGVKLGAAVGDQGEVKRSGSALMMLEVGAGSRQTLLTGSPTVAERRDGQSLCLTRS